MKKIIYLLSILSVLVSCNKTDIFSVKEIEGEFTDYKGDVIYAVYENFESGIITDTIYLDNLKFKKNLKLNDSKTPVYLLDSNLNNITTLFLKESDKVSLSGSSQPYQTVITGDSTNILLANFFNENSSLLLKYDSLKKVYIEKH